MFFRPVPAARGDVFAIVLSGVVTDLRRNLVVFTDSMQAMPGSSACEIVPSSRLLGTSNALIRSELLLTGIQTLDTNEVLVNHRVSLGANALSAPPLPSLE